MSPTGPQISKLSREQKTGFVFMLVFAIMTIGLGALQLRNTVYGPFVIKPSEKLSLSQTVSAEEARLKSIDTDKDGLNDFVELNEFITSPYLADSDSDGVDDKTEIDRGSDPLCAEGKPCAYSEAIGTGSTTTESLATLLLGTGGDAYDSLNQLVAGVASTTMANQEKITGSGNAEMSSAELEAIINDPNQLRTLILSTGKIDSVVLQSIDNVTLQKMARNLFVTVSTTAPLISSPSSTPQ